MKAALLSNAPGTPDPELWDWIAQDAANRVTLMLLAAEVVGVPSEELDANCQDCANELAAYIETELEQGADQAARTYPGVWWHLWTCQDCAEIYRMTYALVEAEQRGEIPPLPVGTSTPSPIPSSPPRERGIAVLISFTREFLNTAVAPFVQPQWVASGAGSEDEGETVLADEDTGYGYRLTLSLKPDQGDHWPVIIAIDPSPSGQVALRFGDATFRSPLMAGQAVVEVPRSFFTDPQGPPMRIGIEADDD